MSFISRGPWTTALAKVPSFSGVALAARRFGVRRLLCALGVLLPISVYYVFLASAGTFHDLSEQLDFTDQMCEGFRHGHLYIRQTPSPALVAATNPYNGSYLPLWIWDASLYKGHYYLYWGPIPALFLLAFKVITGSHERITDQWPTTLFMLGRLYAAAALLLSVASRARLRQPAWITTLAIAVFGLACPSPSVVARPHVYETALAGGQCFLFWGLFFGYWGLVKIRWRRWLFLLAGLSWALAVGCRATNAANTPLLVVLTAVAAWYGSDRSFRSFALDCLGLGAPYALGACALGLYNYARFDSVTEFGVSFQTTLQPFFGVDVFIIPNVFSYLFAPVRWSCRFPFVNVLSFRPLSTLIHWPSGYQNFERVAGIMIMDWWCWLLLLCFWRVLGLVASRMRSKTPPASSNVSMDELWLLACSMATIVSMLPALRLWEAAMRYLLDPLGGLLIAATLGVFWLLQRTHGSRRKPIGILVRAAVLVVGVQTCVVGALAAFTTNYEPIPHFNPTLYDKLVERMSLCKSS